MAVQLKLGSITFENYEVPETIPFGGEHRYNVHQLIGGKRVIDALGRDDAPIEWNGLMFGQSAQTRARYLDHLRVTGEQVELSLSQFLFKVVVKSVRMDFEREWQIRYSISCLVVEDLTKAVTSPAADMDTLIATDMSEASGLVSTVNNSSLSGLFGNVQTAISEVSSFATATQATINGVLQPINAMRGQVGTLLAQVNNSLLNVATLGGILPNNPVAAQVSGLLSQVNGYSQCETLARLDSIMGRVQNNVILSPGSASTVTTAGGNLYQIAADAYGDATKWLGLADANGLTDPQLTGIQTVQVPAHVQ